MKYIIYDSKEFKFSGEGVYLRKDHWNDWFKYNTLYDACYVDKNRIKRPLGLVKIGKTKIVNVYLLIYQIVSKS